MHFYSTEKFPSPKSWNVCRASDLIIASSLGFSVCNSTITNFSSNSEMQRESSNKFPWKTSEVKFDLVRIPSFKFRESQTRATVLGLKFSNVLFRPSPNEPLAFWDVYISNLNDPVQLFEKPCASQKASLLGKQILCLTCKRIWFLWEKRIQDIFHLSWRLLQGREDCPKVCTISDSYNSTNLPGTDCEDFNNRNMHRQNISLVFLVRK